MTWCDKLSSTPAVGYLYEPYAASGDRIIDSLTPLINTWYTGPKANFTVAKHETLSVELQHDNGFVYHVSDTKASVSYQHRLKLRNTSAGLPVAELISQPLQFSKILDSAFDELVKVALALPQPHGRNISRVGVVSTTIAAREDIPPGIMKMIEYFGRPWDNKVQSFNLSIQSELRKDDQFVDRCTHFLIQGDDEESDLITFKFDWQRTILKPVAAVVADLNKLNSSAVKSALAYFEDLAVGNAFDEHLIRQRENVSE
ncbi:hypothetical protein [Rhizobium sp. Root482]|uniref:hypothetical protein n=1 Tax=Rhizobium sp. Root482 TaxID=1736543 RepID=UPI0006FBE8C3|nr:hypothetical protein [Rhizobium sp. Root482]KQY12625.1 hypothetical protein ASD31_15455 [Rhizobium sp. Root482]